MRTVDSPPTRRWSNVAKAAQIGASLQTVSIVLPLLDLWFFGSVERHVQNAYPEWGPGEVAADRDAICAYLVVVGVLGLGAWLAMYWSARRNRGTRAIVTTLFVLGLALVTVTTGMDGGAYARIVPTWLGVTLLCVPLLPGVTALVAAWTKDGRSS